MADRLAGKVALVTGGTAGIGEAVVRRFCAEGADVVFTGRNAHAAAAIMAETGAHFIAHDAGDAEGWDALMAEIANRHGRLDCVFSNVGINAGDASIEDIELDAWRRLLDINLTGMMLAAKHGVAAMKANPDGAAGSIILNSSINGIMALAGDVAYSTTKGALRLLAKSVAVHSARAGYRIRCNSIHPGLVATPLIEGAIGAAPDPGAARAMLEGVSPMQRMADPAEIAGLATYLASDEAAFVTGAEYVIDGGALAGLPGV
ncbi:MAG: SDR family oxidoreductase [Pseudomonadota bacterium]